VIDDSGVFDVLVDIVELLLGLFEALGVKLSEIVLVAVRDAVGENEEVFEEVPLGE